MADETKTQGTPSATPPPTLIKVALVEDERDLREGLATIIKFTDGFHCVGAYRSMEDALEKIGAELPDVVLVDIGLPGMNGIDVANVLRRLLPKTQIAIFTNYIDVLTKHFSSTVGIDAVIGKGSLTELVTSLKKLFAQKAPSNNLG